MATILELFKNKGLDKSVKEDTETLIEQETSGIRVKSLVDVNNPLIYGNESIRIAQRSTPLLEDMKEGANGGKAGGGLVGGLINKARDFANSTIGIPETQTPTRVAEKIDGDLKDDNGGSKIPTSTPITKDIVGKNGTEVGKFLKSTGGGNPKTLGKQALGAGIGVVKDKVREGLFGKGQTIGEVTGEKIETEYTNTNTYTDVLSNPYLRNYEQEGGPANEFFGINLSLVSPVYGIKRTDGKFGRSDYSYEYNLDNPKKNENLSRIRFSPDKGYEKGDLGSGESAYRSNLEKKYGLSNSGDSINRLGAGDYDSIDDYGRIKKGDEVIGEDLIPFNIGKVGEKRTPFRAIITGLNETVSPSWSSNKFLGNPFPFYTYSQIERSTSFNLKIVCNSPLELSTNWEKIESLTKMSYPNINKKKLTIPPIIQFRLGDIYYDKHGFIESLTYTIPDNGTWETNGELGYLPKFVEVSITIKFIEDTSVLNGLYGYKKSKAAIEKINEENNASDFNDSSINPNKGDRAGSIQFNEPTPMKVNVRAVKLTKPTLPTADMSGLSKIKTLDKGTNISVPKDTENGVDSPIKSQSAVVDKLEGKTPAEAVKQTQSRYSVTPAQSLTVTSLKAKAESVKVIQSNQLPKDAIKPSQLGGKWTNSIIVHASDSDYGEYLLVNPNGERYLLLQTIDGETL